MANEEHAALPIILTPPANGILCDARATATSPPTANGNVGSSSIIRKS